MRWHRLVAGLAAAAVLGQGVAGAAGYESSSNKSESRQEATAVSDMSPSRNARIDLNSASKDELKSLPGVGEEYAQRIIDNRPYKSKRDLAKRNVVPKTVYKKIAKRVTVKASEKRPVKSDVTR